MLKPISNATFPNTRMRYLSLGFATVLYQRRTVLLTAALTVLCAAVWVLSLCVGQFPLTVSQVLSVIIGRGEPLERTVVIEWRLARSLVGLAVGAALGLSGAITQRVTRNGLASPDIVGINQGASVGAVAVIVAGGSTSTLGSYLSVPLAAFAGAALAGIAMWLLARQRTVDMFKVVLVGIGINACLHAFVTYLLAATDLNTAAAAKVWMVGSLNGRTFTELWPTLVVLVLSCVILQRLAFYLPALELGEDTAQSLGVPLNRVNSLLLVTSVGLAAVAVSACGPVGFVAFVSPHIARTLARGGAPPLAPTAAAGALLVCTADLVARTALGWEIPVGIVTSLIGGPYLIWLLWRHNRANNVSSPALGH